MALIAWKAVWGAGCWLIGVVGRFGVPVASSSKQQPAVVLLLPLTLTPALELEQETGCFLLLLAARCSLLARLARPPGRARRTTHAGCGGPGRGIAVQEGAAGRQGGSAAGRQGQQRDAESRDRKAPRYILYIASSLVVP
jgi:hypothetical protein